MPSSRTSEPAGERNRPEHAVCDYNDGTTRCNCGHSVPTLTPQLFWYHLWAKLHPSGTSNHNPKACGICQKINDEVKMITQKAKNLNSRMSASSSFTKTVLQTLDSCSPIKCDECSFTSVFTSVHKHVHRGKQDTTKRLWCPQCPFSCDSLIHFQIHSGCHPENGIRIFECKHCELVFTQSDMVENHLARENKENKKTHPTQRHGTTWLDQVPTAFNINRCGTTLPTEMEYLNHLDVRHGVRHLKSYFQEMYAIAHVKVGDEPSELSEYCKVVITVENQVDQSDISRQEGNEHNRDLLTLESLGKGLPVKCESCSYTSEFAVLRAIHENVHSMRQDTPRIYCCRYCPYQCDEIPNLELHYRCHAENQGKRKMRLFQCDTCEVYLHEMNVIQNHVDNSHANRGKPHTYNTTILDLTQTHCLQCSEVFRDEISLLEHLVKAQQLKGQPGQCSIWMYLKRMYGITGIDVLKEEQKGQEVAEGACANVRGKYIILTVGRERAQGHQHTEVNDCYTEEQKADGGGREALNNRDQSDQPHNRSGDNPERVSKIQEVEENVQEQTTGEETIQTTPHQENSETGIAASGTSRSDGTNVGTPRSETVLGDAEHVPSLPHQSQSFRKKERTSEDASATAYISGSTSAEGITGDNGERSTQDAHKALDLSNRHEAAATNTAEHMLGAQDRQQTTQQAKDQKTVVKEEAMPILNLSVGPGPKSKKGKAGRKTSSGPSENVDTPSSTSTPLSVGSGPKSKKGKAGRKSSSGPSENVDTPSSTSTATNKRSATGKKKRARFRCIYKGCEPRFECADRHNMQRHIKTKHLDYRPFYCERCNFRSVEKYYVMKNLCPKHPIGNCTLSEEIDPAMVALVEKSYEEIPDAEKANDHQPMDTGSTEVKPAVTTPSPSPSLGQTPVRKRRTSGLGRANNSRRVLLSPSADQRHITDFLCFGSNNSATSEAKRRKTDGDDNDNRGPPASDSNNREPLVSDNNNRGPLPSDNITGGLLVSDIKIEGPLTSPSNIGGLIASDGNIRGPPANDGNTRGPPANDGNTRGPLVSDGNTRGPLVSDGNTRGPLVSDGNTEGPSVSDINTKEHLVSDEEHSTGGLVQLKNGATATQSLKESTYHCLHCERFRTSDEGMMKHHVRNHINYKPGYVCQVCKYTASEKHHVTSHIKACHRTGEMKHRTDPDKERQLQEGYRRL